MRSSIRPVRAALITLLVAIPARSVLGQSAASDSAAIHEASRAFSAAYVRGDAAAMAATYTDDAAIFPGESDRITGRSAITRYWTLRPGRRVTRHLVTPAHVTVDGAHAYDYGVFEIAGEQDGKPWGPFRGKYVAVWRREGSSWRMVLDIWNSGPRAKTEP
jgi:ketosteroid isomerase-like protein